MRKFTIVSDLNFCAGGSAQFRIHKEGCKDVAKQIKDGGFRMGGGSHWTCEAESAETLVESELASFRNDGMEFTREDFLILPCAK